MQNKIKKYLFDINESIESINGYLEGKKDFNKYLEDKLLRRAVEREFEIIGEAINNILQIDEKVKITNARKIVNLRNFVIHGYDKVDDVIIWGIIVKDLPTLEREIKALLKE